MMKENLSEQGEGIFCKVVYGYDKVEYEDVTEDVACLESRIRGLELVRDKKQEKIDVLEEAIRKAKEKEDGRV